MNKLILSVVVSVFAAGVAPAAFAADMATKPAGTTSAAPAATNTAPPGPMEQGAAQAGTTQNVDPATLVGVGGNVILDASSTINVNVTPWIAPCAGTLKNLRVFGFQAPSGSTVITIYKATVAASPTYSATTLTCTVASGTYTASDTTNSVSISAGDLIVAFCNAFWATNGCCVTTQFVPT